MKIKQVLFVVVLFVSVCAQSQINDVPTIAVLNFQSNTGDPDTDAMLSTGTPETIITDLSNIREIQVVDRTRIHEVLEEISFNMTGLVDDNTIQEAGRLLGAQYIVVGTWQKYGEQFRVNARLVEVKTSIIVVGIKETGNESKIFDIQDNISAQILSNLKIEISPSEEAILMKKETVSIDAYKQFSRGLVELDKGNNETMKYYMAKALDIDPNYVKPKEYIWVSYDKATGKKIEPDAMQKALGVYDSKTEREIHIKNIIYGAIVGTGMSLLFSLDKNSDTTVDDIWIGSAFGAFVGLIVTFNEEHKKEEKPVEPKK